LSSSTPSAYGERVTTSKNTMFMPRPRRRRIASMSTGWSSSQITALRMFFWKSLNRLASSASLAGTCLNSTSESLSSAVRWK
jgi:hypothetical protein